MAIGGLSAFAPLFGRTVLVWLINASSFAVLIAFLFVAISFLVLRVREPDMPRPFRVRFPRLVGWGAVLLTVAQLLVFFPPSASALSWPQEWLLPFCWALLGAGLFLWHRARVSPDDQPDARAKRARSG